MMDGDSSCKILLEEKELSKLMSRAKKVQYTVSLAFADSTAAFNRENDKNIALRLKRLPKGGTGIENTSKSLGENSENENFQQERDEEKPSENLLVVCTSYKNNFAKIRKI